MPSQRDAGSGGLLNDLRAREELLRAVLDMLTDDDLAGLVHQYQNPTFWGLTGELPSGVRERVLKLLEAEASR